MCEDGREYYVIKFEEEELIQYITIFYDFVL